MRWDWEHRSTGGQWTLSIDGWHAAVQRLAGPRMLWQATLERTRSPHERYESPPYPDAMDARSWCLRTIAALTSPARGRY
jgi:hypothetical protein